MYLIAAFRFKELINNVLRKYRKWKYYYNLSPKLILDCFLYMTIRASKDIRSLMPKSYDIFRIFKKYPQEQNA